MVERVEISAVGDYQTSIIGRQPIIAGARPDREAIHVSIVP